MQRDRGAAMENVGFDRFHRVEPDLGPIFYRRRRHHSATSMDSALDLKIGHLYFVDPQISGHRLPKGLRPDSHVLLIYRKEDWCLVKTWQGKIFSVPEKCLSID